MQVQAVSFAGNISKGRKEFEKLPLAKQVALKSMEKFRQEFNQTHIPPIPAKDTDLAEYVQHVVFIENLAKSRMKEFFTNWRNNI